MKTRDGFVSNSSSSSFLIAIAPDCAHWYEALADAYGINDEHPLRDMFVTWIDTIRNSNGIQLNETDTSVSWVLDWIKAGWKVYEISGCSDGGDDPLTIMLHVGGKLPAIDTPTIKVTHAYWEEDESYRVPVPRVSWSKRRKNWAAQMESEYYKNLTE